MTPEQRIDVTLNDEERGALVALQGDRGYQVLCELARATILKFDTQLIDIREIGNPNYTKDIAAAQRRSQAARQFWQDLMDTVRDVEIWHQAAEMAAEEEAKAAAKGKRVVRPDITDEILK